MRIDYLTENFEGEDFLVADGFDDAIIGVDENSMRIIYSVTKSIEILMKENMKRLTNIFILMLVVLMSVIRHQFGVTIIV